MKKVYKVSEAAEILNQSPYTLRVWLRGGRIKGFKLFEKGQWMIPVEEIERIARGEKDERRTDHKEEGN